MLEHHEFCDHCHGCRPAIMDPKTGKVLGSDHPIMRVIDRLWDNETTYAQRKAFIELTLHNSRDPDDVRLAREVIVKIDAAIKEAKYEA